MAPSPSMRADGEPLSAAPDAPSPRAHPTPVERVLAPRLLGVPWVAIGLLLFTSVVVLGNFLPTRARTAATARALARQDAANRGLAERIRAAEAEAVRLETDPWINERILRDELRMTRPGEVRIR